MNNCSKEVLCSVSSIIFSCKPAIFVFPISDCDWVLLRARGVILMRLEHAGKIQSASLISAAEEEEEQDPESASLISEAEEPEKQDPEVSA